MLIFYVCTVLDISDEMSNMIKSAPCSTSAFSTVFAVAELLQMFALLMERYGIGFRDTKGARSQSN